jgi:hypothetical protein
MKFDLEKYKFTVVDPTKPPEVCIVHMDYEKFQKKLKEKKDDQGIRQEDEEAHS